MDHVEFLLHQVGLLPGLREGVQPLERSLRRQLVGGVSDRAILAALAEGTYNSPSGDPAAVGPLGPHACKDPPEF